MTTYKEFKSKIFNEESRKLQIEIARTEYKIEYASFDEDMHVIEDWIPFNLEREYFDYLISEKRYTESEAILARMKASYTKPEFQNFIESYQYRLNSILHSNKNILENMDIAKKDFNNHSVTIISVIVGVIAIFGTANNQLNSNNFEQGALNFLVIVSSVLIVIFATLFFNKRSR